MTNTAPVSEMRFVLDRVLGADRLARSVPHVRAFALVRDGHGLMPAKLGDPADAERAELAAFHRRQMLPEAEAFCMQARAGATGLYASEFAP